MGCVCVHDMITVSTHFDVCPWDLATMILEWSRTSDPNRCAFKYHLEVIDLLFQVSKQIIVFTSFDAFSWTLNIHYAYLESHVCSSGGGIPTKNTFLSQELVHSYTWEECFCEIFWLRLIWSRTIRTLWSWTIDSLEEYS